jgi:hypothetical protein
MNPFNIRTTIIGGYALNKDENYMTENWFYNGLNTVMSNTWNMREIIMSGDCNERRGGTIT